MALELEGLISHLLILISCAGEGGCSINEIVNEIRGSAGISGPRNRGSREPLSRHAIATIWGWLVMRCDVSVGLDRKYNNIPLHELLNLTRNVSGGGIDPGGTPGRSQGSTYQDTTWSNASSLDACSTERIYVSEETMWETVTGHSVNYKRVPRSEWLLLLGIASTKNQGILQGDLGRLVDQDKRSVPKRTDALVKKGYIVKRTTLVKGTKTSKLWLKLFAPPLPKETDDHAVEREAEMILSHHILAANLDPVPWHMRWTGDSMDFHALATTIMATTKEWQVIRLQDLKAKLGVLGMRWQMKIVSKICRFLNSCGAIQYVAAKLDSRLFKDCIRFNKDLSTKDWSAFLATGKRADKPVKTALLGMTSRTGPDGHADVPRVNGSRLGKTPPWSIDDPLPQKIIKAVTSFRANGLTNPEIYALTLGPTFNRYISSMTTSMATSNVQPLRLQHIRLRSEHLRVGKVASYRYYIPQLFLARELESATNARRKHPESSTCIYWFEPLSSKPKFSAKASTISNICGLVKTQGPFFGDSNRRGRFINNVQEDTTVQSESTIAGDGQTSLKPEDGRSCITLQVSSKALQAAMGWGSACQTDQMSTSLVANNWSLTDQAETSMQDGPEPNSVGATSSHSGRRGRGRSRGSARGKGRGRPSQVTSIESPSSRPWICETCGGSWKNDIGLKYHLEKSQTPCNPQYTPGSQGLSRRGRKSAFFASKTGEALDENHTHTSSESPSSRRDSAGLEEDLGGQERVHHAQTDEDYPIATSQTQLPTTSRHMRPFPDQTTVKSWKQSPAASNQSIKFSAPKTDQGLLFQPAASRPRQISILQNPKRHTKTPVEANLPIVTKDELKIIDPLLTTLKGVAPQAKENPATVVHETGDAALSSRHSGSPVFDHGPVTYTKPKTKRRNFKNDRADVRRLIQQMISDRNGVLLGGKLLWQHLLETWNSERPEEATPNRDECQSAVNRLLKDGSIMEHWHMFRDSTGSFSKCQLLTLPGVDAFSPESLRLLETVRLGQAIQSSDMHSQVDDDTHSSHSKSGGRGRRLLAREVATLHAPVYAAQVAAKRDLASEIRERGKRQRPPDVGNDTPATRFSVAKRRKQINSAPASREAGSPSGFHDLALPQPETASAFRVRFLQPNAFLEQDAPNTSSPASVRLEGRQIVAREKTTEGKSPNMDSQTIEPFGPLTTLTCQNGAWAYLDAQYFERVGGSFSMKGWMPNANWFQWASFIQAVDQRRVFLGGSPYSANDSIRYQEFMRRVQACFELEMSWEMFSENLGLRSAGPHNIWVDFQGEPSKLAAATRCELSWPGGGQLTQSSYRNVSFAAVDTFSSSSDEDFEIPGSPADTKRAALVTRALTPLVTSQHVIVGKDENEPDDYPLDAMDELMAAFIAVRTLMGGADKAIDWGLLMNIFPNAKLMHLRRFWDRARKEKAAYIANFTRAFQERFIAAIKQNEIPMIDFEKPKDYDWTKLIQWTLRLPCQEGIQVPSSRELFNIRFGLESTKTSGEDWRERFFHTQASIFSRFEAVTAVPGVFIIDRDQKTWKSTTRFKEMTIARSWIKSLCSMGEGKYSVEEIRDKFFTLNPGNKQKTSALFKEAIECLTRSRVICKSKKPPLGGRPYRLNEGYVTALSKMAQSKKYDDAAAFKTKMDAFFRKQERMRISYTLSDGAMMALTNLAASGRIKLESTDLPNIPLGFEPGNYESRKYPKSYYHFGLEAMPTESYLYNEQIHSLQVACEKGPPVGDTSGELPQWVDFFGEPNQQRWSEILGAFCFSLATRGSMDTDGICSALSPVLDEFEARLIEHWGKETGVLSDFSDRVGLVVGEWWWLTVPWLRRM
ncbi:hypothetical protein ED733_007153 [Metarhizium rileyi]|uniref:Uncharacterized protein n=1 Tax=Metarhizium rileyi (strain RCEF 4871) TaxID=1649241 RepID=A0A5C6GHS6_METRR|nr:hypothetical protein ED733_007153 [Metarhizium rileyi]